MPLPANHLSSGPNKPEVTTCNQGLRETQHSNFSDEEDHVCGGNEDGVQNQVAQSLQFSLKALEGGGPLAHWLRKGRPSPALGGACSPPWPGPQGWCR